MASKDTEFLYEQIANSIREDILEGRLHPGDRLPSVRQMTDRWNCTIGTVQRAYHELSRQGLVISRAGQGTSVVGVPTEIDTPLRKAELINRAEAFLLEVITSGYSAEEIEDAVRQAMERWQAIEKQPARPSSATIRFSGSHDIVVSWIASHCE
ncbi:MAG: GntR family transcriptional regulator, partial [Anaerolineales bacterium]|nr:GntR family transcriptional regulator [Anaerolineales bacterium]